MQVLIVDDVLERQENLTIEMLKSGCQVTSTASRRVAEICIKRAHVDVLVMAERVAGKLTHSLALLAEYQNPMLSSILITPRDNPDVDELFELLPSLHCIVGSDVAPETIRELAIASMTCTVAAAAPTALPPLMRAEDLFAEADNEIGAPQEQEAWAGVA